MLKHEHRVFQFPARCHLKLAPGRLDQQEREFTLGMDVRRINQLAPS